MTKTALSSSRRLSADPIFMTGLRVLIYALAVAALGGIIVLQATREHAFNLYAEDSLTEYLQFAFLAVSVLILAKTGSLDEEKKPLCALLAGILSAAAIRECDWLFERHVFDGAWQTCAGLVLAATAFAVLRRKRELRTGVESFTGTSSFGIMLSGFLIVGVFSRIFGMGLLWKAVMGPGNYNRMVKGAVEENVELLGYFLILAATIEMLVSCTRSSRRTESQ